MSPLLGSEGPCQTEGRSHPPAAVALGRSDSRVPTVVQFSTRKEGVLPLWDLCVEVPNVYTCPVERFLQVLSAQYSAPISEQHSGLADAGE